MPPVARTLIALLPWLAALVPPALYVVHLSSPEMAVEAVVSGRKVGSGILVAGLAVAAVLALLYPPFIPALRLALRRVRTRLGTDLGPLREAQGRLRHLETPADHLVAGRVLFGQGRLNEAIAHLGRAAELDPDHAATRYQLGLALAAAGALQAAAEQLQRAVQLDPEHAFGGAMLELGIVLERGGADEAAIEVLRQHEQRFGFNRRALLHRARALARTGQREAAIADLERAAAPPPDGRTLSLEDQLARARARVALMRGGKF